MCLFYFLLLSSHSLTLHPYGHYCTGTYDVAYLPDQGTVALLPDDDTGELDAAGVGAGAGITRRSARVRAYLPDSYPEYMRLSDRRKAGYLDEGVPQVCGCVYMCVVCLTHTHSNLSLSLPPPLSLPLPSPSVLLPPASKPVLLVMLLL